jgi:competence CoiA-like predicted nuclease
VPLKAIVEGETVTAPDLSEEEWTGLKLRHKKGLGITMACCGGPGHMRISNKGTRHFYHAAEYGCHYEQESKEHLEIKEQIYRVCRSENWEASVEYPSPDRSWISDVYATRDGRKVVFEIQISTISLEELEERDRKYRAGGIESYWLLENLLERSKVFASWYDADLFEEIGRPKETIPYIDPLLFATGPENHIFIAKGIRSVGLHAKKQTLFTTSNLTIPLATWVREVLKGNYRIYLNETAAAHRRKQRLLIRAAPALIRFRDFYQKIFRGKTYREKAGPFYRMFRTGTVHKNDKALQKKFQDLCAEIGWLENEYRSWVSESSGLFTWKKSPDYTPPRLYFRLESESNVKKLLEQVTILSQWEASFERALGNLEREIIPDKKREEK